MSGCALGVCWYPEHWPEERWATDAAMMRDAGLSWVRIGEFAWSRLEPAPGRLDWGWMDRAAEALDRAGLKIILGTPTATPPRWMLDRHPDMLAVDAEGRPRRFGSRRHYCFSHTGYREECVRIATLLGERYGADEAVRAWQIDNEYGCHGTTLSYSDAARNGFRRWLADRYGDIAALNAAWGAVFWSMEYQDFEQIDLPNLTVTEAAPAHRLDFRRYSSDQVVAFNRAQAEVLRRLSPGRDLIHNFMGRITDFDHFAVAADLDVAAWDSYPLGFLEDRVTAPDEHRRRYRRQGDPDFQAFHHDLYRAVGRGRMWVMEQQPGPVNWAPANPAPMPGMVRTWTEEAAAHGAEAVVYFRWRQAPMAQEQMHAGLLRPDAAPAPGLAEAKAAGAALAKRAGGAAPAEAALIFDYESAWAWEAQPQGAGFSYFDLVFDAYRALRRAGFSVDVLPADASDFGAARLAVIPGLFRWRPALVEALRGHAGAALIGPRAGSRDADFRIPERLPPDLPPDLLDARVAFSETLRADAPEPLKGGGALKLWRESLEIGPGARVLMACDDGSPALIAQGPLRYLAGWPDDAGFDRVIEEAAAAAGLEPRPLSGGLRLRLTPDGEAAVNYGPGEAGLAAAGAPERALRPASTAIMPRS